VRREEFVKRRAAEPKERKKASINNACILPHYPHRSPLSPLLLILPELTPSASILFKEFGVALLIMECDGEGESGSGSGGG
jgi:hypothetical protein